MTAPSVRQATATCFKNLDFMKYNWYLDLNNFKRRGLFIYYCRKTGNNWNNYFNDARHNKDVYKDSFDKVRFPFLNHDFLGIPFIM